MPEAQSPPAWPLESSEEVAQYEMFGVRHDRARDPGDGRVHDLHVVESPEGVVVIAVSAADELVLVEQYRHGVRRLSLEVPAGIVDEGEDPVAAGLRELREETGYVADRGELLGTLVLNPSWQTTRVHVVLARGAEPRAERELDDGEDTRVRCLTRDAVRDRVRRGEVDSAVSVASLQLLDLNA